MDEIVERVARAIWFAEWEEDFPRAGSIEHVIALNLARVAVAETLRVVREPPFKVGDAMRDMTGAGYPYSPDPIRPPGHLQIGLIWRTGLESLLATLTPEQTNGTG